jgi:hypothetical protein
MACQMPILPIFGKDMSSWIKGIVLAGGTLAVAAAATLYIGRQGWAEESRNALDLLAAQPATEGPDVYSPEDELPGLPEPVRRFFEFALTPGQPLIKGARIVHEGDFRASLTADWRPFRSTQHFTVRPAGFVWDADINMAPLVNAQVRDSYIAGKGTMRGKLARLVTIVNESGTPHMNAGSLHRYFLEAGWLPTALLPSQGVKWEALDDSTAIATLTDSGITLSMTVHFGASGEIVMVEADRVRDVNGEGVPTPFRGRVWEYEKIDGMMIPVAGEVEWLLPEGVWAFWRGRIVEATYHYRTQ